MEVLKKRLEKPAELQFFGTHKTSQGGYMSDKDFSATKSMIEKSEKSLPRASFVFRNNVADTIAPSGKIEFAINGSRLYFRDGGQEATPCQKSRSSLKVTDMHRFITSKLMSGLLNTEI